MFQVEVDTPNNLLRLAYAQRVGVEDAIACAAQMEQAVPSLKPGFRLLTDLTALEVMDVACAPYIRAIMDLLDRHGIGVVVRVIPDPSKDIGMNIMSLFHYRRGVRFVTCETLAEAMEALKA